MDRKPQLDEPSLRRLLARVHGRDSEHIEPIAGGFWSSAYGYSVGNESFVLRLGFSDEGYRIDQQAAAYASAALPIPEVIEIGSVDHLKFAISRRLEGEFVETRPAAQADAVGESLTELLFALRTAAPNETVDWYAPESSVPSWAAWLRRSLEPSTGDDWRDALHPRAKQVFDRCVGRIEATIESCPERRDWVHGDLLHQNVLVGDDGRGVTGVFSWKCSARGDFLYDVAWCTFWSPWYPVIADARIWERMNEAHDANDEAWRNAGIRHHCYELQIAASHFGWYVKTDDRENLDLAIERAAFILDRGSLADSISSTATVFTT